MPRFLAVIVVVCAVYAVTAEAQRAGRTPGSRLSTASTCAASLGAGLKSKRTFCDVMIGKLPKESVAMAIPAHTGSATLMFDLHNRFTLPTVPGAVALAFARHEAIVNVVKANGDVLARGAVVREFRTTDDLFDQITGGGRPGGVKAIAPGPAESLRFVIPAGVNAVGIVGARLQTFTRAGGDEVFETAGRPVAIVSNLRIEYVPAAR